MPLKTLPFILLAYAGSVSATAKLGAGCSSPGTYDCSEDFRSIAVCNGSWQLAASCGGGSCVWPAGYTTPWCHV